MTSSVVELRRSSKVAPEKVMVTIWWSAAHPTHYTFLNPSKTITSEKYTQEIRGIHRNVGCNTYILLTLVNRMGPILHDSAPPHIE